MLMFQALARATALRRLPGGLLALGLVLGLVLPVLAQPARVTTAVVEERVIVETVALNGSVTAPRTAQLSSDVEGRVTVLPVALGQRVDAGTPLLELDAEEIALQVRSADAELAEARAVRDDARRRLAEANRLVEGRNIAGNTLNERETDLAIAEASVARRRAERDRLAVRLERHRLRAPFGGQITRRNVTLGEWAEPGMALLTLIDLEHLTLDFAVSLDLHHRLADATLEVRLPGNDAWLAATPIADVPVDDGASRQFLLRATLDAPLAMLPGMAVRGRLLIRSERGPSVPRDALVRRPDGSVSLWLAREEAGQWRAAERRVDPGASHAGRVAVSDIAPGTRVILRGNERLEEGQQLTLDDE